MDRLVLKFVKAGHTYIWLYSPDSKADVVKDIQQKAKDKAHPLTMLDAITLMGRLDRKPVAA